MPPARGVSLSTRAQALLAGTASRRSGGDGGDRLLFSVPVLERLPLPLSLRTFILRYSLLALPFTIARAFRRGCLLRKEVIQPLVPQRLPCYDFIPITTHTLGGPPPRGSVRRLRVQTAFMM